MHLLSATGPDALHKRHQKCPCSANEYYIPLSLSRRKTNMIPQPKVVARDFIFLTNIHMRFLRARASAWPYLHVWCKSNVEVMSGSSSHRIPCIFFIKSTIIRNIPRNHLFIEPHSVHFRSKSIKMSSSKRRKRSLWRDSQRRLYN